jgi:hypothetical protein
MFARQTSEHVLQGVNPGGVYQAIWCRDASYILGDWFFSGNYQGNYSKSIKYGAIKYHQTWRD